MIQGWIDEAVAAGAQAEKACETVGLSVRTVQRWKHAPDGDDGREGRHTRPSHALTESEQRAVLAVIHRPEHHDASPKTIVAKLADQGTYVASESTMYRLLRAAGELTPRGRAKAPVRRETPSHRATGHDGKGGVVLSKLTKLTITRGDGAGGAIGPSRWGDWRPGS